VLGIFKIGSLKLFAWGWIQTTVLLISAFWVARITGMRWPGHNSPFYKNNYSRLGPTRVDLILA
jgi:hypothetical protein